MFDDLVLIEVVRVAIAATCIVIDPRRFGSTLLAQLFHHHERPPVSHFSTPRRRLSRVVSAGRACGRPGREQRGARLHGDQALGLWAVGEHPALPRCTLQGDRAQQCLFPPTYPAELPGKGSAARGRLCHRMRGGHASSPGGPEAAGRQDQDDSHRQAGGALCHSSDQRNDHRCRLRALGRELSRPAPAD